MKNIMTMTLKLRNQASTTANNLKNTLNQTTAAGKKLGTTLGQSIKAANTSMGGLMGALISVKALIIAAFAVKVVRSFTNAIKKCTEGVMKQEEAVLGLAYNLAAFNNYSRESITLLIKQASFLQNNKAVADDVVISYQSLLASYGMEANMIRQLTPLVIDFAKAKRIELKTAFDLVGKASVGYTGTLSRYGIIIDSSLSKTEKFAETIKAISVYEGSASAQAKLYSGQVSRLKAAFGDMLEPLGKVITRGYEKSGVIETLISGIIKVTNFLEKWNVVLIDIATKGLANTNKALVFLGKVATNPTVQKWLVTVNQGLRIMINGWKILFTLLSNGFGFIWKTAELAIARANEIKKRLFGTDEEAEAAIAESKQAWDGLMNHIDKGGNEVTGAFKDYYNTTKDAIVTAADVWDTGGLDRYKDKMEQLRQKLLEQHAQERNGLLDNINNRGKYNAELDKTFKLTQSMAQQFATSSRLEQEQTKWLLQKIQGMSSSDVGNLSEQEKKIISKQGVLKEAASKVFGEYSAQQLGIKMESDTESEISIGLTDEAREFFTMNKNDKRTIQNRRYERAVV